MDNLVKKQLQDDMKTAMKAHDKETLGIIRLILAAIKQQEIDKQITLDETQTFAVLEKMTKQRRDSINQFKAANRNDLVEKEEFELKIIQQYLPEPLSQEALDQIIQEAIQESGAISMKEMGKVMAIVKPKVQGRADMGLLGTKIKALLSS